MTYITGLGGPSDKASLKLETRKRNWINNVMRLEANPEKMRAAVRIITDAFPSARPVSASRVYNCYGMAFAARRTAIVDSQDVEAILHDDDYRKLPWDTRAWLPGDVVIYRDADAAIRHVAIIMQVKWNELLSKHDVEVLSTWGESGEYLHPMELVHPLLGRPTEVRSQRFML